jgi:hypothetical protein
MREYTITRKKRLSEKYDTMIILRREDWIELAEYRLTPGQEKSEIARMRRAINRHLNNGGTLKNYQW